MSLLCSKPWWVLHFTKSRSQSASNGVQDPISLPLSFFTTLISPPATICLPPSVWTTLASCFLNTVRCSCRGGLCAGHSFYPESSLPWYICIVLFLIFLKSMLKSHLFHVAYPVPIPMLLASLAYLPFLLYSPHPLPQHLLWPNMLYWYSYYYVCIVRVLHRNKPNWVYIGTYKERFIIGIISHSY